MNKEVKVSGWLLITYSLFMVIFLSCSFSTFFEYSGEAVVRAPHSLFGMYGIFYLFFILINLMGVIAGIMVVIEKDYASRLALPFSIVSVLNVPVGTIVGGLYIWQYMRKP